MLSNDWQIAGEMAEWLKAHAWKACILQKSIEGSNPSLSASLRPARSAERILPRRSAEHAGGPDALFNKSSELRPGRPAMPLLKSAILDLI